MENFTIESGVSTEDATRQVSTEIHKAQHEINKLDRYGLEGCVDTLIKKKDAVRRY